MFSDRNPIFGITFVGAHAPGQKIKNSVVDGDSVILKLRDESVLVRDVTITAPGEFSGIVYGFEPSCAVEFGDLKLDDRVTFSERHIISCGSA